ncbi:adhesion G protein-coupled receptor L1-like isoform X1 [Mercenaria mercenaria]|uniref:adhesion G protein-coupled receptor L1-like isoform X1 n=1 Tax=Mercenaria mercenaria TaxID=6596 RepID=UPI00234EAC4D|nr:adhesion G protein-coupled receptor L1-like isoform X1 [Mercenaria mercenaria]XP_045158634.2 adhesion G protein-coupled receptor L1-like isoform X1 [Mercenaria mercenaria]XP_045158635.2 adhesion G protein-coupled receptor L1-like isoform X1 [Mercenaria mercenaria]XP_045158637.2 adhesion G protein-coupled receptor L1-like isoform X1 [Mercenaria mercenaria]XP_045158638.2 adhesion G protein-coupled receptor L1-like isoform X1 [Mercenaria mercenaria]XP_045158639.2 adhesion G protein-coupled rec
MGYLLTLCFLILSLTCLLKADYPATYPSKDERKVAFACQNSYIHLSCKDPGKRIRILLANYGRFSLVVCNQDGVHKGWNVQCSSPISMEVVTERCDNRTKCTFQASNALFGDPCPDTKKYIEVRYFCERANEITDKTDAPYTIINPTSYDATTTEATKPTTVVEDKTNANGRTEKWKNEKFCSKEEMYGVLWEKTNGGEMSIADCPSDMKGVARRHCGRDGKWAGNPDLTDCISIWMDEVQTMIDLDVPAEMTVSKLNSKMKGKALGAGDLKQASTRVIPGLINKIKKEITRDMPKEIRKEKVHSFTKEIVKSGSGLLNNTQQQSWKGLRSEERKKAATSLIISLEQMALEVAATIDKHETVASAEQNIVMEVSVLKMSRSHTDLKLPIMQYEHGPADGYHDFSLPLDGVSGLKSTDDVTVTYLFYNNLEALLNPQNDNSDIQSHNSTQVINSNIIAASIMKHSTTASKTHGRTQLNRPMNFKLSHKNMLRDKVPVCAYWKYNESTLVGKWSEDGCRVVDTNDDFTTCQCDHLTNFAVLMDVTGTKLNKWHRMSLQAITYVGCTVSIVCLLMCFISFSIFRNLQSDRNTIHKNLVLCLMLAELLFLFGIGQTQDKVLCSVVAGFLHFFFLTSFSWMCLEGIQLYFMLIEVFEAERSRVRWFYTFGYGVPAVIVGISAAIDHTGYGTENHCWLRTDNYFILSFVIPAAIVVLINIVMLSIAIYMMCRHAGVTASSIQARQKGKLEKMGNGGGKNSIVSDTSTAVDLPTWLKGSAVLVVLLGLTWTFGFLYLDEDLVAIAYIFTILNSLQGLFIFIFHCFMDRKVKKEWRRAIYKAKWLPVCCRVNVGGYNGNLSSPPTSSSGPQNYFLRFWSSRKRKRSTSSSGTGKNRRSDLDSFLRSDVSSGNTTGTGVNRYSNQSDKLLPNGQNIYTAMPTHYEGGVAGDLSVVDASVIDSEYVTEYCQHNMQVSKEKQRYSSGSDNSEDEGHKDNIPPDSISKDRLSFLSTDSNLKQNSEFTSDNEEGKINYAVLEEGENKTFLNKNDSLKTESERNKLNELLSMYQNTKDINGIHVPGEPISTSEEILDSNGECKNNEKDITKSAPNLKYPTHFYNNQGMDSSTHPLLGSLPDLSTIREEDGDSDPCSKSAKFGANIQ